MRQDKLFATLKKLNVNGTSASAIEDIFRDFADLAEDVLAKGGEILLPGLGKLKAVVMPPRKGRNPRTGEAIDIPARRVVKFVPGKALRELVQEEYERETWRSRRK